MTLPITNILIKLIGCIYCEIVDIEVDLMEHGSSSKYYEKYKDAMADPIQNALLKQSELFFENTNLSCIWWFPVCSSKKKKRINISILLIHFLLFFSVLLLSYSARWELLSTIHMKLSSKIQMKLRSKIK